MDGLPRCDTGWDPGRVRGQKWGESPQVLISAVQVERKRSSEECPFHFNYLKC